MTKKYKIKGLDCPICTKNLEKKINELDCVKQASIDFLKGVLSIECEDEEVTMPKVINLASILEPDVVIEYKKHNIRSKKFSLDLLFLVLGLALSVVTLTIKMPAALYWISFVISALLLGYKTYYKALILLFKGTINENFLVTLSVIGAAAVGENMDALMVIALYSVGKLLESIALNKSKKSIEELTNLKPDYAVIINGEEETKVDPASVKIGDIIVVRPGEKIAVDGVVTSGEASLDTQSLTGESLPTNVSTGSEVLSGAIVIDGVLYIKATNLASTSTAAKIMELIEQASDKKSKTETVISKISKWYTLGVIILAVAVWGIVFAVTKNFNTAIYRGLIFLVVSCPCAFAISVPLAYFSGLGNASKKGILIKGSNYLDALTKLNVIAFDKTGTITTGEFEIVNVKSLDKNIKEKDILFLSAIGEQYSLHPLAKAIANGCGKKLPKATNVKEVAGKGVYFEYNDAKYFVGRHNKNASGTLVELTKNGEPIGEIVLSDKIKEQSRLAIDKLNRMGIQTIMLTGDNKGVANAVAEKVGISQAKAKLLPSDKFEYIQSLKANKNNVVGYVGDGINDAPSLTLSDVGISMGIRGSSATIEASDVVLATDNLDKIPQGILVSKFTRKIVWQNILFAAIVKITFLTLGALGITGMLAAVIADVGVTVLAILNSLRSLHYSPKKTKKPHHKQ